MGKCCSMSSGWHSFFSIEGRLTRALSAADAIGDAIAGITARELEGRGESKTSKPQSRRRGEGRGEMGDGASRSWRSVQRRAIPRERGELKEKSAEHPEETQPHILGGDWAS